MKIKNNSGNFQPCPEYTGQAVCVDVTPLKTVQTPFGPKEKFRFVFEIGEMKDDSTPWCVWSAPFTPSYHENSALRPFLRKWMGREMSPEEIKEFDTESLLGRSAHITVIHEHSDGEIYANIALIQPDKSPQPMKPSGKFVRSQDRAAKETNGTNATYRRAEPVAGNRGDLLATKIHVGRCKGLEVRDLSPEQVTALVEHWLPAAAANPKPSADDKRLMAALEAWQVAQSATPADDDVPY